eukprot:13220069-Alexandrium_andersonii.AAC.1
MATCPLGREIENERARSSACPFIDLIENGILRFAWEVGQDDGQGHNTVLLSSDPSRNAAWALALASGRNRRIHALNGKESRRDGVSEEGRGVSSGQHVASDE